MPTLAWTRTEIERMRLHVSRQKRAIRELQEAGISTDSAEALLQRMTAQVEALCADRDRMILEERREGPKYANGKRIYGTPAQRRSSNR